MVTFWYAYGDLVRKVLLDLVARFNASQSRIVVKAVHQGDYFEALAKLRTAIAAGAAPTLSHVVLEVLPYLARAGVLEPLDGYEGARSLAFVPALAQSGSFACPDDGAPAEREPLRHSVQPVDAHRVRERAPARAGARVGIPRTWDELAGAGGEAHEARRRRRRPLGIRGPHLVVVLGRDGGSGRRSRRRARRARLAGRARGRGGAAVLAATRRGRSRDAPSARPRLPGVAVDQRELLARARRHDVEQHRVRALPRGHRALSRRGGARSPAACAPASPPGAPCSS